MSNNFVLSLVKAVGIDRVIQNIKLTDILNVVDNINKLIIDDVVVFKQCGLSSIIKQHRIARKLIINAFSKLTYQL